MNILFVADVSITKIIGGAERVLFEQSTRLAQRGHKVSILTKRLPEHKTNKEHIQGVWEWRYEVNYKNSLAFLLSSWRNSNKLFQQLHRKQSFDCINIHQPISGFGVIHSRLTKDLLIIYTCHSLSFEEFQSRNTKPNTFLGRVKYLLNTYGRKWIEKDALSCSDEILVLSQYTKDKLFDVHRIKYPNISIIPGGINAEEFHPAEDKLKLRRKHGFCENKVIYFTVRNLVPRMGLENLINAFSLVVKETPDIYLFIGGDGPLRNELIALTTKLGLNDIIGFTGYIPEQTLPSYYQMADIFVLATKELEGFGLVTLEAMASGLPVIGTEVGATSKIIGNLDPGFLFKGTDSESIAALVLETYYLIKNDLEKYKKIAQRFQKYCEMNYSWEKNVESFEKKITIHL